MTSPTLDTYEKFLESKRILAPAVGFEVAKEDINPKLFPFQNDICRWALRRGKAAVFAHTGLGKGPIQLEWCKHVSRHTQGNTLILAPLAVAQQFQREADKFGYALTVCQEQSDVRPGINVLNYDRTHLIDFGSFTGVSMDESSILRDWNSETTKGLIDSLAKTPFKLCCTATPAPNDHTELGNHAEILDVMTRNQMLAVYFEHDGGETSKWALKGHGKKPFWRFVSSWALCVLKPSDLGYSDELYDLPPLNMHEHIVPVDHSINTDGMLYRCPDMSATGLHKEMRITAASRAAKTAELVRDKPGVPWIIWVNTDYDADVVRAAIPKVTEVRGKDSRKVKEATIVQFVNGEIMDLSSKVEIFGRGLNLQHCRNMVFMGASYGWEGFFQGVRRCWRFGQTEEVNAHLVAAETEGPILKAMQRKQAQYEELTEEMNAAMRECRTQDRARGVKFEHCIDMQIPDWLVSDDSQGTGAIA